MTCFPERNSSLLWNFSFKFCMHFLCGYGQNPLYFQWCHLQNGHLAAILDFLVSKLLILVRHWISSTNFSSTLLLYMERSPLYAFLYISCMFILVKEPHILSFCDDSFFIKKCWIQERYLPQDYINSLTQDSDNTIANAVKLPKSCTKSLMYGPVHQSHCYLLQPVGGLLGNTTPLQQTTHFALYKMASTPANHGECEPIVIMRIAAVTRLISQQK